QADEYPKTETPSLWDGTPKTTTARSVSRNGVSRKHSSYAILVLGTAARKARRLDRQRGGRPMSDIDEAKAALPLPRLMHQVGLGEHAKKSAHCPFHNDQRKSFSVFQDWDDSWYWSVTPVAAMAMKSILW